MTGMCAGRVAIVTGAGRGIGREHALLLARHGASVVVNDVGSAMDGTGRDSTLAEQLVAEIASAGGVAAANGEDISTWDGAQRVVAAAIDRFGQLDVVVNNAGVLRDRMLVNMTESEWDTVMSVHLRGTAAMSRWAAEHWRERAKAGEETRARIINTSSASGIYGNPGQSNYAAAKAGIAALTIVSAMELGRYGATVNAVAPAALTRMTSGQRLGKLAPAEQDRMAARHIAPIVCWLASTQSTGVTGRVFDVSGQSISVADGWSRGASAEHPPADPESVGRLVRALLDDSPPNADVFGLRAVALGGPDE